MSIPELQKLIDSFSIKEIKGTRELADFFRDYDVELSNSEYRLQHWLSTVQSLLTLPKPFGAELLNTEMVDSFKDFLTSETAILDELKNRHISILIKMLK